MIKKSIFWMIVLTGALTFIPSFKLAADSKLPPNPDNSIAAQKTLVDINSASKKQLMTLPDVGETYAQRIIENRPYKTKAQLKAKHVISVRVFYNIIDKITAK